MANAYHPPGRQFRCNLCRQDFGTTKAVKRHFDQVCFRLHAQTHPTARW
jgi:hypothetical protein